MGANGRRCPYGRGRGRGPALRRSRVQGPGGKGDTAGGGAGAPPSGGAGCRDPAGREIRPGAGQGPRPRGGPGAGRRRGGSNGRGRGGGRGRRAPRRPIGWRKRAITSSSWRRSGSPGRKPVATG